MPLEEKKMKKIIIMFIVAATWVATGARAQQPVGLAGAASWNGSWLPGGNVTGYNPRNIWIDIWVHNICFRKEVGIIWTDNSWYSFNWNKAAYELTYRDGVERWGVDLQPAGTFMWHRSGVHGWIENTGYTQTIGANGKFIEYVIYFIDLNKGNIYWDNNHGNNHRCWVVHPGVNGYLD